MVCPRPPHRRRSLAALALALALSGCGEPAARPRSVILVSLDTLRADHTGPYGYARETTPALARLARESVVYERAFTAAVWTLVAHMTMLTGLYPPQHGVLSSDLALAPESPTLAERLRAQGYQTIGLYHEGLLHPRHGFGRGFDVFRKHDTVDDAGQHLAEALAGRDPRRPLFLFVHLFDVHCGPLDTRAPGPIYDCPPPYDEFFLPGAAQDLPAIPELALWNSYSGIDERARAALAALYDGGVRQVDDALGAWVEDWRASGLLDEALLIVTADHGESLAQRGYLRWHGGIYQEGLRVPLIVRRPDGWRAGEREPEVVHHVDLLPTVLDWAGAPPPDGVPGRSLFQPLERDRTVLAFDERYYKVLVRWPEKLAWIRYPKGFAEAGEERWLRYDLERDPEELSPEAVPPELVRARLAAFAATQRADLPPPIAASSLAPSERAALDALGYGGEK